MLFIHQFNQIKLPSFEEDPLTDCKFQSQVLLDIHPQIKRKVLTPSSPD